MEAKEMIRLHNPKLKTMYKTYCEIQDLNKMIHRYGTDHYEVLRDKLTDELDVSIYYIAEEFGKQNVLGPYDAAYEKHYMALFKSMYLSHIKPEDTQYNDFDLYYDIHDNVFHFLYTNSLESFRHCPYNTGRNLLNYNLKGENRSWI